MEGYCDFSRYKHCISFGFDCIQTVSKSISNDDHNRDWDYEKKEHVKFPSIVYNIISEVVIARGKSEVGKVQLEDDVDLCCVLNIFMELNNVFLKAPQRVSKSDMLDNVITSEVVKFLQDEMIEWEKALKCSKSDFCYAFTLPTGWNYEIQEKLIRPLFISAGLISKYNHPDRLLFFTQLESVFRCIQSDDSYLFKNIEVEYGRQYAMCSLNFADGEIFVNLDLSSAQYPSLTSIDSKYVPQSLKSASFQFPFELKEKQTRIKAIVEKKCDTLSLTNVHKLTDILTNEGNTKGLPQWMRRIYDPEGNFKISDEDILNLAPFQEFLNYRPFKQLQDLRYKKYSLENEEIRALKSITITDIYGEFLEEEAFFTDKLNDLFQNTNKAKLTTLMLSFTKDFTKAHHALVLLKLVEKWLKSYDKQQGFYRLLTHVVKGPYKALSFEFGKEDIMSGTDKLIQKKIKESNKGRLPKIIPSNTRGDQFENFSDPICIVNIDILPTKVEAILTHVEKNDSDKNHVKNIECDLRPINSFIKRHELYQRPILYMVSRMILCLKFCFGDHLKVYPNSTQLEKNGIMRALMKASILKRLMRTTFGNLIRRNESESQQYKIEDDVFSMDHRFPAGNEEDSIAVHQHVYVNCFLIAYLYNLNKFIEEKLDEDYGDEWKNKNIAFTVSVDKYLLDKVFGSKERLNELFYASGVLQKDNRLRKAQIFSYGEEILPAIQQRLTDLDFKMKSYFVVAQIHPKHIQLTLHQVVKLSSYEENTATIIIQDEIVQIEDVYDSLCKNIWMNMLSSIHVNSCSVHKNIKSQAHCFGYKNVYQKLKLCVVEIMNSNITSLDMEFKYNFNIGNDCACKTVLFLRNIIEIGLKPVLQSIATIIASSMNNATLFSNYELDFLFVIGNVFELPYKSAIYYTYIKLVQEAINISIESKEKDTKGIVLHESFRHLLEQVTTHKKPYMFDRFSIGTLGQVFRETYGIRFLTWRISSYIPFSCTDFIEDGRNALVENGSFLVVVQKGQPVPITGLALEFELYFKERLDDSLRAELIRMDRFDDLSEHKSILLEENAEGVKCELDVVYPRGSTQPVILDFKHVNYDYTLQLSVRAKGDDTSNSAKWPIFVENPLTLAYT